jgi:hypothetical protein
MAHNMTSLKTAFSQRIDFFDPVIVPPGVCVYAFYRWLLQQLMSVSLKRTISPPGDPPFELCDTGLVYLTSLDPKTVRRARNELSAWQLTHPAGPPAPPSVSDLIPHGNSTRVRAAPVYFKVFGEVDAWMSEFAIRMPDGRPQLPSKLSWRALYHAVFGVADVEQHYATFYQVCKDMRVRVSLFPFPPRLCLPSFLFSFQVLRFDKGSQRCCALCFKIVSTSRSALYANQILMQQKTDHFEDIKAHNLARSSRFEFAHAQPQREVAIAVDFADAKESSIPQLGRNVCSLLVLLSHLL